MDSEMRTKLERLLQSGEITQAMYDEMVERWKSDAAGDRKADQETDESGKKDARGDTIKISGFGSLTDAIAHKLMISGSGKISGNVEVDLMDVSGSGTIVGSVIARDALKASGSLGIGGRVRGGNIIASGSLKTGEVDCDSLVISGGASINGKLRANEIRNSGSISAETIESKDLVSFGVIKADRIASENIHVRGAVNSEHVICKSYRQESMGWSTNIGKLESDIVDITSKRRLISTGARVSIDEISGKKIALESTNCNSVKGEDVVIKDNCDIGYVEAETLSVSSRSRVREKKVTS